DFVEGDVEDGAAGLAQVVVWDVGSDADNFVDRVIGTAFKGAADGVLAGEEGLDEGFVDDGGSRRGVFRAKVAAGNEGDLHRREPARRNVQQPGRSRAGRRAVDGDVAVYADAPEKRPARDGDRVDAGGGTKRLGSLIPDYGELAFAGDGFQQEQTVGGETEGAVLQALEGCDEERREKEDEETESDLKSDGSPHETAWRVRILTTFERGDGPDGGGTESRKQTKQYNDQENEPEAEEKHTPVGGKGEARRVVGRIDEAEHKGRRPRSKECAKDGSQEGEQRALSQDELDEATTAGADRDAESHLMGAGGGLGGHHVGDVDAGDEQNESDHETEDAELPAIVFLQLGDAGAGGMEDKLLIEIAVDGGLGLAAEALGA